MTTVKQRIIQDSNLHGWYGPFHGTTEHSFSNWHHHNKAELRVMTWYQKVTDDVSIISTTYDMSIQQTELQNPTKHVFWHTTQRQ
jgi:hypothetical protein